MILRNAFGDNGVNQEDTFCEILHIKNANKNVNHFVLEANSVQCITGNWYP